MVIALVVIGLIAVLGAAIAAQALSDVDKLTGEVQFLRGHLDATETKVNAANARLHQLSKRKATRVTLNVSGGATIADISKAVQTEARLNGTRCGIDRRFNW